MKGTIFSSRSVKRITTAALVALVVIFVWGVISPALALETGLEYGTLTGLGTQDIRISLMQIVRIFLGFVGIIAIIIIIYAGFVWMTSAGNPERIDFAKRTIRNAVIGLIIILAAFAIVSFIINSLQGIFGGQQPGGGPPGPCDNCGHLGGGVIESVFPEPFARDVPRNTNIMVTFKVPMDPTSIINGSGVPADPAQCVSGPANPCVGTLIDSSVGIYVNDEGFNNRLNGEDVVAASNDGRTFVFNPTPLLGDGVNNIWYATQLTNGIRKDNGDPAFSGSFGTGFTWRFEVGTLIDLDPVEEQNVFPIPDDLGDNYSESIGTQASAVVVVNGTPNTFSNASVTTNRTAPAGPFIPEPGLVVNGAYNGSYNGTVTLTLNAGVPKTTATASWSPVRPFAPSSFPINNNVITLGDGITLSLVDPSPGADQWEVTLTPLTPADTLRVGNRTYTFVNSPTPGVTEIQVDSDPATLAATIAAKVDDDVQTPNVSATNSLTNITLQAVLLGETGNSITYAVTGSWLSPASGNLTGGTDSTLVATTNDAPDKPRNAVIKIDFNEALNPLNIDSSTVTVQYDDDPSPATNWVTVDGQYFVSNVYRTVEFLSNSQCGVCAGGPTPGDPCGDDSQCGSGGSCQPLSNSCGDVIYCLPTLADGNSGTVAYDATHYRVIAKAGLLQSCTSNADCGDPNYPQCVPTDGTDAELLCAYPTTATSSGDAERIYPTARITTLGITDAANNSFNGNRTTYSLGNQTLGLAEGPEEQSGQPPYNLNLGDPTAEGDDLIWSFYINKQVDLTPPLITQLGPNVGDFGVSLTAPLESTFDELMFGATMKPGTGYQDGFCGCNPADDQPDGSNPACLDEEICDAGAALINGVYGKCKNPDPFAQLYCSENQRCSGNGSQAQLCINKKYLSLIDRSTAPVGWWVTHQNLDTVLPLDGYGDITKGQIQHTKLLAVTDYAGEAGSGLKDVYQNCYLPSEGPSGTIAICSNSGASCLVDSDCPLLGERCEGIIDAACGTTASRPYCCNGTALDQPSWEASACFTSY